MTRAALLVLLLLLPLAAAQPGDAPGGATTVELAEAGGVWNGATTQPGSGLVPLWVPAGARLHAVEAVTPGGPRPVPWRALGPDGIQAELPPEATAARATYDFRASSILLATYVAPAASPLVVLQVRAPEGLAALGDPATFHDAGGGLWTASVGPLAAGDAVRLRVVDADRVGELPVLLAVALVAALSFLALLAWHRLRPPLEGRPATRFLEHLVELQARLAPVAVVFVVLNFAYFAMGLRAVSWRGLPLVAPTFGVDGSLATRAFEAFAERLVPSGVQLVVLRPADAVLAQVQMTLFLAFVSVLPLLLYELAVFVGPGLRPRERRVAVRVVPLVTALFAAGALFGFLLMAPLMIRALYAFAPATGAAPLLVVGDLIGFTLVVVVAFGLAFELPITMYLLARLGVAKASTFRHYLRHAILGIVILAGVVTPDPSVVSQLLVAAPVTALYLIGMLLASFAERRRARSIETRATGA